MDESILDILDRKNDFNSINIKVELIEEGLRTICGMYDEHSDDKQSFKNIFRLKDNIYYRLSSASHQYKLLLEEHYRAENYLLKLSKEDPNKIYGFILGNPYFQKIEVETSSIFDSIIFHLSSIFDYLSHTICYICKRNKSETVYWTKLVRSAQGKNNEICELKISEVLDGIHRKFVSGLYDYRSRLLHYERDSHKFTAIKVQNNFEVRILSSKFATKHFKTIKVEYESYDNFTICFLSSWLIKTTLQNIDAILIALMYEIKSHSSYYLNLRNPKAGSLMLMSYDQKTRSAVALSEKMWADYRKKCDSQTLVDKI